MGSEHRKYRQLQLEANKCLLIECTQYLDCDVRSLMINCLHVPHALNLLALLARIVLVVGQKEVHRASVVGMFYCY